MAENFDFVLNLLQKMGRFTLIPSRGYLDEAFLMESVYTLLDKANVSYIVKKAPDETDEQVVLCSENVKQVEMLLANPKLKQVVFLPNRYMDEKLACLLDERCTLFCQDSESFESMRGKNIKAKVYQTENWGFEVPLKALKCPTKIVDEIPLGKRYLIWQMASLFIPKMKILRLGNTSCQVGYFLKKTNYPEAEDVTECYLGNFVYRPMTRWLAELFVGIIKGPDIIVTNVFAVAALGERLGKTVFIWQDKHAQGIQMTKLSESARVYSIAPKMNLEGDLSSILQNIYITRTGTLKAFNALNPVPEADIKLKLFTPKIRSDFSGISLFTFKRKVVHLAFITDENYAMMTGVAIQSAIENKNENTFYNLHILGYRLSDFSKEAFKALESKKVKINMIDIPNLNKFKEIKQNRYITPTALLKFDLPILFDKLDKILYLDGDLFIQGDLWDFYNKNIKNDYAAVVKDAVLLTPEIHKEQSVCRNNNYFNSGVLLLNLKKMRKEGIPQKLLKWRLKHGAYFMDQDALNAILSKNVKVLDCWYNFLSHYPFIYPIEKLSVFYRTDIPKDFLTSYKKALILHYPGKNKPHSVNQPYLTSEFMRYLFKTKFSTFLK